MTAAAQSDAPDYTIRYAEALPSLTASWDDPAWQAADILAVDHFHPRSSDHRPKTQARVLHDGDTLALMFRVEDRYVIARHTEYQEPTHLDSCVEFFVQPEGAAGYFNFEFNAIGTLLLWYVRDPRRVDGDFADYDEAPERWAERIKVQTSLTAPIEQEHTEPVTWTLSCRIPLELFEAYAGELNSFRGRRWTANVYKCADDTSHPHWAAWADVGDRLDFHQPERFGTIVFE